MRRIIFWSHLIVGLIVGLFVLIMSVTGVLITYEHAIINQVSAQDTVLVPENKKPMPLDEIVALSRKLTPSHVGRLLVSFRNRADAPVTVYQLRHGQFSMSPYSGERMEVAGAKVESFFHSIVDIHRWLALEGKSQGIGRAIMAAANLAFLFLIVTGVYLWLPRIFAWLPLKQKILFLKSPPSTKARNYNWHHVFGFWALFPLILIVGSGVIISYPWANQMLYAAFGEEAPKRQGPAFLSGNQMAGKNVGMTTPPSEWISLESAFELAKTTDQNWTRINVLVALKEAAPTATFLVNNGGGILPEQRTTMVVDRSKGEITSTSGYADMQAAQKARMWVRFIHTGEQYGFIGSTIAGLASLAACFLVYTGMALSYRRFFKKSRGATTNARQNSATA